MVVLNSSSRRFSSAAYLGAAGLILTLAAARVACGAMPGDGTPAGGEPLVDAGASWGAEVLRGLAEKEYEASTKTEARELHDRLGSRWSSHSA